MKRRVMLLGLLATLVVAGVAAAGGGFSSVKPKLFDPKKTYLVGAKWEVGLGCPTNSKVTFDGVTTALFTDGACPTADPGDKKNTGLLLAKTRSARKTSPLRRQP